MYPSEKSTNDKAGLAVYDPRFAAFQVPGLADELKELEALRLKSGRLGYFEALEAAISF